MPEPGEKRPPVPPEQTAGNRLDSWKEIAAYLKHDARTVQRWEKADGLPVFRHPSLKRGTVYAYKSELDAWLNNRRPRVVRRRLAWAAAIAGALLVAGVVLWTQRGSLSALRRPGGAGRAVGVVARQLWAAPGVSTDGAPFPDGRYLSFVDWETGDLALRDLAAGRNRRLTNKGSWQESDEFAETSVPSPDGREIAYAWFSKDGFYELRSLPVNAQGRRMEPRVLFRSEAVFWIRPFAWSRDGKHIIALFWRKERTNEIALIAVADGSLRILRSLGWHAPERIALSPDGRFIAYDLPAGQNSPQRDIFVLALEGGGEARLVEHPADDHSPLWSPDGKSILFASDRTGALGLWAIPVAGGQPRGSPQLVKQDLRRLRPLGMTPAGAYYYATQTGMQDIYVAEIEPATGRILGPPKRVSERFLGSSQAPAWSPDGRYLAYRSSRTPGVNRPGSVSIVIHPVEGGEERDLPVNLAPDGPSCWFPHGRSLMVSARDHANRWSFHEVNAQTGQARLIWRIPAPRGVRFPTLSPDGKAIFYQRNDLDPPSHSILAYDLESRREKLVHRVVPPLWFHNFAISRDGQWLACKGGDGSAKSSGLYILPVNGGERRELLRDRPQDLLHPELGMAWTPDGRHVLTVRDTAQPVRRELWRVPVDGGPPQQLGIVMGYLGFPAAHPDARRIAFTGGQPGGREIWVLENFLSRLGRP